jgi:hypothetical protein
MDNKTPLIDPGTGELSAPGVREAGKVLRTFASACRWLAVQFDANAQRSEQMALEIEESQGVISVERRAGEGNILAQNADSGEETPDSGQGADSEMGPDSD